MSSATSTDTPGFRPWHFFVVVALGAATVAVMMSRRTAPEHLVMLSLTVFAAGAAGIAAYLLLAPLVGGDRALRGRPLGERTRAALEAEKMLALRAIKELEFDRAMGKVSDEDFAEMSLRLRARAVRVLQQLDETGTAQRERIERELDERLGAPHEGGVKSGASKAPRAVAPTSSATATAKAAAPAAATEAGPATGAPDEADDEPEADAASRACPACETANDRDARFCKQCGGRLQ